MILRARLCDLEFDSVRSISLISTVVKPSDESSIIYKEFSERCYYQSYYSGGCANRKEAWYL